MLPKRSLVKKKLRTMRIRKSRNAETLSFSGPYKLPDCELKARNHYEIVRILLLDSMPPASETPKLSPQNSALGYLIRLEQAPRGSVQQSRPLGHCGIPSLSCH